MWSSPEEFFSGSRWMDKLHNNDSNLQLVLRDRFASWVYTVHTESSASLSDKTAFLEVSTGF